MTIWEMLTQEQKKFEMVPSLLESENAFVACVLAKLAGTGDSLLWLGQTYLLENPPVRAAVSEKGYEYLRLAVKAGGWDAAAAWGLTLARQKRYLLAARVLEEVLKYADADEKREQAMELCRTLGVLHLTVREKGLYPYQGEAWLEHSIEQYGDANAAYTLGKVYREGKALYADAEKALRYFTFAADHGHVKASVMLVRAFIEGDPILGKPELEGNTLLQYLKQGTDVLDPEAVYYNGVLNCVCHNWEIARQLLEHVKDQQKKAYGILGQLYYMQGDYYRAYPYLRTACEELKQRTTIEHLVAEAAECESERLPWLTACMGDCYARGLGGCPVDREHAVRYFEDAAGRSYISGRTHFFLAGWYIDGREYQTMQERMEYQTRALYHWHKAETLGVEGVPPHLADTLIAMEKRRSSLDGVVVSCMEDCVKRIGAYAWKKDPRGMYEYARYYTRWIREIKRGSRADEQKVTEQMRPYLEQAAEAGIAEAKEALTHFKKGIWEYMRK